MKIGGVGQIRTKDPNNHSDTETGTLSTVEGIEACEYCAGKGLHECSHVQYSNVLDVDVGWMSKIIESHTFKWL